MKWIKVRRNLTLEPELKREGEDFFISYLDSSANPWLGTTFMADGGGSETALIQRTKDGHNYYILNGDFRTQYEALVPRGWQACLDFYNSKPELHSSWSSTLYEGKD